MTPRTMQLHSRSHVYSTLVGIAAGMLLVGLSVPFIAGDRVGSNQVGAGGSASPTTPDGLAGTARGPRGDAAAFEGGSSTATAGTGAGAGSRTHSTVVAPGASGAMSGSASLGATDQGVSPTSVKVGFLLLDIASATRFAAGLAGIDPEQQKRAIEAYVADINDRGGVNGRRIQAVFRTFDVLSRDDQRAACLDLTEDQKVFAVVAAGGYGGPPVLCITEEHGVPFINLASGGAPSEYAERSNGLLFTLFQLGDRQMANWVQELDQRRALTGRLGQKRLGILSDDNSDPGDLVVGRALLPALERAGHEVTHRSRLASDLAVGAGQIPVEVQQMRSKQVEVVLLPANSIYASQFVSNAENQGWTPDWYVTDFGNMSADAIAENMPDGFEGAQAITVTRTGEDLVGAPEPAVDAACRQLYERRTGERLPRLEEDGAYNNTYGVTLYSCGMIRLFEAAAGAAGAELTRPAFSAAMLGLGEVALPRFGGGSLRAGKFDATDLVRTNQWYPDCTCWKPIDDFRPARF